MGRVLRALGFWVLGLKLGALGAGFNLCLRNFGLGLYEGLGFGVLAGFRLKASGIGLRAEDLWA